MSRYLIKTVETYRVGSEEEAKALIEESKKDKTYVLTKYLTENKELKQKGEVVEEWKRVTLTKVFNEEKEPWASIDVSYNIGGEVSPDGEESVF